MAVQLGLFGAGTWALFTRDLQVVWCICAFPLWIVFIIFASAFWTFTPGSKNAWTREERRPKETGGLADRLVVYRCFDIHGSTMPTPVVALEALLLPGICIPRVHDLVGFPLAIRQRHPRHS